MELWKVIPNQEHLYNKSKKKDVKKQKKQTNNKELSERLDWLSGWRLQVKYLLSQRVLVCVFRCECIYVCVSVSYVYLFVHVFEGKSTSSHVHAWPEVVDSWSCCHRHTNITHRITHQAVFIRLTGLCCRLNVTYADKDSHSSLQHMETGTFTQRRVYMYCYLCI